MENKAHVPGWKMMWTQLKQQGKNCPFQLWMLSKHSGQLWVHFWEMPEETNSGGLKLFSPEKHLRLTWMKLH